MNPDHTQSNTEDKDRGIRFVGEALRAFFNMLRVAAVILVVMFCFSGVRTLKPHESGIVTRFGDLHGKTKTEPGLVFAMPYPIDHLVTVPSARTQSLESTTFWTSADTEGAVPKTLAPGVDGYLLTADHSIFHARCTMNYDISNPVPYVFDNENVDDLLRRILDNAMIRAAATLTVDEIMSGQRLYHAAILTRLNARLEALAIGLALKEDPLNLQLQWPRQLETAIQEVMKKRQEGRQTIDAAVLYERIIENEIQSRRTQIILEAETWRDREIARVHAEGDRFEKLYGLYKENPEITKQTLYQDRIRDILAGVDEILLLGSHPNRDLRLYLQRRQKRQKDRENPEGPHDE